MTDPFCSLPTYRSSTIFKALVCLSLLLKVCITSSFPVFDLNSVTLNPIRSGFTIKGASKFSTAGDIDNDGYDDIILGDKSWNNDQGVVYVIYGGPTSSFLDIDLRAITLDPFTTGFMIKGPDDGNHFGNSVSTAGDIDGDGFDDIIIGVYSWQGCGAAYVIYGGPRSAMSNLDLSSTTLNSITAGFRIQGNTRDNHFGEKVSAAGDINNDGFNDILISTRHKNNNKETVYVIYGQAKTSLGNIDLSLTTLSPTCTGFTITGFFVESTSKAGDINNDGYDDIILGDKSWNHNQGAVYVIYGGPTSSFLDIDLSAITLNPFTTGLMIKGPTDGGHFGNSVSTAGDINNDGYDDMIIGAKGAAYVIYGGVKSSFSYIVSSTTGFIITTASNVDILVSTAGDVNQDGYSDMIVRAQETAYVIYGGENSLMSDIDLSSTILNPIAKGFVLIGNKSDSFENSVSPAGDINGDGYDDIIIAVYGNENSKGSVSVIYDGFSQRSICPTNCKKCSSLASCTECASPYLLYQSQCIQSCPEHTYLSAGKCEVELTLESRLLQITGPIACSATLSGACSACAGYNTPSGSNVYVCTACRQGYYMSDMYCPSCPTSCSACSSATVCSQCKASYSFIYKSMCYASCPTGSFQLTSTTCGSCSANCDQCDDSSTCTQCASSYFLYQSKCFQSCPTGAFQSSSTTCASCSANCEECDDSSTCTQCASSYFLYQLKCEKPCPVQTFSNTVSGKCESCSDNCDECTDSSTCTKCEDSYFLYQLKCFQPCPTGAFQLSSTTCGSCSTNCDKCDDSSTCTQCESSYFLYQLECYQPCPIKTFPNTASWICENCSANCDKCDDSSTCTQCESLYLLYKSQCFDSCPSATFLSSDNLSCEDCSLGCASCLSLASCETCSPGYFKSNSLCESCSANCDQCVDSSTCTQCASSYFLYQSECYQPCPSATFLSSDNLSCEDCALHCASCTSRTSCQKCDQGYALKSAVCAPPSSSLKAEAKASQAIASAVTGVGSVLCVGSSTFPITALVSKIVQNTRYLNLSVTDDLADIYQTWGTEIISWELPNALSRLDHYEQLPSEFARYDIDSPFLVNFWPTLVTIGASLGVLIMSFVLQILTEHAKPKGWFSSLLQGIVNGSRNFAVVQAYGCLDEILFDFVLDLKSSPFDSAFSWTNLFCGIGFIALGVLLIFWNLIVVRRYQKIKKDTNSNPKDLEAFNEKNKVWELFYADFSDHDFWSQSFLALAVFRSSISTIIVTVLHEYPLMQTISLIIIDEAVILFLFFQQPFVELHAKLRQYYFEGITLLVHICTFILSFQDSLSQSSDGLRTGLCTSIMYLNTALVSGSIGFMFIEIYEAIKDKIKASKQNKLENSSAQEETMKRTKSTSSATQTIFSLQDFDVQMRRDRVETQNGASFENNHLLSQIHHHHNLSIPGLTLDSSRVLETNIHFDDSALSVMNTSQNYFINERGPSVLPRIVRNRNRPLQQQRRRKILPLNDLQNLS